MTPQTAEQQRADRDAASARAFREARRADVLATFLALKLARELVSEISGTDQPRLAGPEAMRVALDVRAACFDAFVVAVERAMPTREPAPTIPEGP